MEAQPLGRWFSSWLSTSRIHPSLEDCAPDPHRSLMQLWARITEAEEVMKQFETSATTCQGAGKVFPGWNRCSRFPSVCTAPATLRSCWPSWLPRIHPNAKNDSLELRNDTHTPPNKEYKCSPGWSSSGCNATRNGEFKYKPTPVSLQNVLF